MTTITAVSNGAGHHPRMRRSTVVVLPPPPLPFFFFSPSPSPTQRLRFAVTTIAIITALLATRVLADGATAKTFQYYRERRTWTEAQQACRRTQLNGVAGQLAVASTTTEINDWVTLLTDEPFAWVGLRHNGGAATDEWQPNAATAEVSWSWNWAGLGHSFPQCS